MPRRQHAPSLAVAVALAGLLAADAIPAENFVVHVPCGARERILEHLAQHHGETVAARGLTTSSALLEVLSDPEDGTWTLLITESKEQSCVLSAGTDWQRLRQGKGL